MSTLVWWVVLVISVSLFCFTFIPVGLFFFHSYLVVTNQTTYETMRKQKLHYLRSLPEERHPFSRGFVSNVRDFCSMRPGVDWESRYTPEPTLHWSDKFFDNDYYSCC